MTARYALSMGQEHDTSQRLRVASYNVKGFAADRRALWQVLKNLDADVLALQEPPRSFQGPARLRALAHSLHMECVVPGGYPFGGVTTALLVADRISSSVVAAGARVLPWGLPQWWPQLVDRPSWPSRRGFSWVDMGNVVVVSAHLGLNPAERVRHGRIIMDAVNEWGSERTIVAGDLNEEPGGPVWELCDSLLPDARPRALSASPDVAVTFPSHRARRRIDSIFVPSRAVVWSFEVRAGAAVSAASDHRPVVIEVDVPVE